MEMVSDTICLLAALHVNVKCAGLIITKPITTCPVNFKKYSLHLSEAVQEKIEFCVLDHNCGKQSAFWIANEQPRNNRETENTIEKEREEQQENVHITGDIFSLFNPLTIDKSRTQPATTKYNMGDIKRYLYKLCPT